MLRLLSIGMISLLLYQSAGFVVTFELGVSAIRKEVREKFIHKGEGKLVRLAFHRSANIVFKDEGQEIYHQQNMYDILRQEVKGDSIIFTCFHDLAESKLVAAFEKEVKAITDEAQSEQKSASTSGKKIEYLHTTLPIASKPAGLACQTGFNIYNESLTQVSLANPAPPPKVL